MKQIEIPSFLSHLKTDARGYPVPFFVPWIGGKPDFRMLDANKQKMCVEKNLCSICGKKLHEYQYFITGPMGKMNGVHSDPPMHKDCAEYSINVCPHLHFEKAERNDREDYYKESKEGNTAAIYDKPKELFIIKADRFKFIPGPQGQLVKFREVSSRKYVYIDGTLQQQNP